MPLSETSPLDQALSKIMDAPASQEQKNGFELAPRSSLIAYENPSNWAAQAPPSVTGAEQPTAVSVGAQQPSVDQSSDSSMMAATSTAAPKVATPLLSYEQYVAQQGGGSPNAAAATGYNQYTLAQPRAQPFTRDEYAKTMTDQYARAGWNRSGIVPPSQQLIDAGYESYLQGAYRSL